MRHRPLNGIRPYLTRSSLISEREVIIKGRPGSRYEAVAAKLEAELGKAFADAFFKQGANLDLDEIAKALEAGDIGKVLELLDFGAALAAMEGVSTVLAGGLGAAGVAAAAGLLPKLRGVSFAFNVLNPRLITWLQTYSLRLIREVNEGTREGVRQYLLDGMRRGKNPKAVATQVKGIVGLTDKQAQAVANFRAELETFHLRQSAKAWGIGNKIDRVNGTQVLKPGPDGLPKDGINSRRLRDFRYDGQLKRALEQGKPLTEAQIDKMVAAYQRKYIAYRARTIARTEAIRTTNKGVEDAWQQAIDKGVVSEDLVRKRWIVAKDERLCETCSPIPRLNPKAGVKHSESFKTPKGPQMLPPMHPNCRCTVFYQVYEPGQIENINGEG